MAAIFLAPPSSPSLRHSIATIFVYLVLNFKINTARDVRRDSTYLLRPERSKFQVSVPVQAQVPIVKHVRKKKFLFSSISYYPNATSRFQINRISISGDVAINPGPQTAASNTTKDKCSICSRTVASNHRAIECDNCLQWCHIRCGSVTPREYQQMINLENLSWLCPKCMLLQQTSDYNQENLEDGDFASVSEQGDDPFFVLNQQLGDRNLKIAHLNINGLLNKLPEVHNILDQASFDTLGISETHLREDIPDEWININGYSFVRRDRDSGPGGGVLIYFKANLTAYLVTRWNCTHLEAAWLNVTIRSQSFLIGCIYRPPQDSLFFNHFRNVLENIWLRRKNIILLGDFNSDMLKGSSKTESQYGKRLKRIISSFGLKNIMSCPSRVTLTSESLIDLIITSQPAKVKNSGAIEEQQSSEELTKNLEPLDPKTLTSYVTRVTPTRCDIELNWELVKKKIEKTSKPNKATGPDLVSPKDLKLLGVSSIHSLLPVFKKSIVDTVFPTNWKLSRVKPVLKKGAPTDMSNFRPISLLSIPGKILEDIISDSIDNHIEAQDLLSDNQWGFRKNHSTEGLLLHLTDTWKWALDENLKVGVLFIDFRKAFDPVNQLLVYQEIYYLG